MPSRATMFLLLSGQNLGNHLIRSSLPMLVPFITQDLGCSAAESALLLGSFFPGYLVTQIPGGWAAQVFGAKIVAIFNLIGNGLFLSMAPLAAKTSRPVPLMASCFAICGLFQGPLVPGQGVMKYPWLPKGVAKAWALRIISLGTRIGRLVAALTPWLCSKFGWQSVPYLYGGAAAVFGIIFQLFASNKPLASEIGEEEPAEAPKAVAELKKEKAVDYGILSVPAAQAIIVAHIGDNNSEYTLSQWAPTVMLTVLNVTPAQLGVYLFPAQIVGLAGGWIVAAVESIVRLKFSMTELGVRRWFTLIGSAIQTLAIAGFGVSKAPGVASLMYALMKVGQSFHSSGFTANYVEVGGPDSGVLSSVGNTLATLPGSLISVVGSFCLTRFGSYTPMFMLSAAVQLLTGLYFFSAASTTTARELLAKRRARNS